MICERGIDLAVKPILTISCITLLNKFNVTDVEALQEKVVDLGLNVVFKLLKTTLSLYIYIIHIYIYHGCLRLA